MANAFDYYYGNSPEQFSYYQIPKALMTHRIFSSLSLDCKVLYAVLRDRMKLSRENGWIDKEGRVFIIFMVNQIAVTLGVSEDKTVRLLKELEQFGLVEKKRRGQGLASLIYVMDFATAPEEDVFVSDLEDEKPSESPENALNTQNKNSRIRKSATQEYAESEFKNTQNKNSRNRIIRTPESADCELINKNKRNKNNGSNNSFNQSESELIERPIVTIGANETLDEREIRKCRETLTQNQGIPYSLVLDEQKMKEMILFLCCGSGVHERGLKKQEEMTLRLIVESLSEMALERDLWDCRGSRICYRHVVDKLNVILQEQQGYYLFGFVDRVKDKYFEGCKGNYIGNPKQYIKAILWSEMCCYSVEEDSYYSKMVYDDMGLGFPQ